MNCKIDPKTRSIIFLDENETFAVEFDNNTQRIEFESPKIVGDNLDLSTCICRINYVNAKGYKDTYIIDDMIIVDDTIKFSWLLSKKVTAGNGKVIFIFCARESDIDGNVIKEWNTTVAKVRVCKGLETDSQSIEEDSDILESILARLDKLENTEVSTVKDWLENDTVSPKYIKNRPGGYSVPSRKVIFSGTFPYKGHFSSDGLDNNGLLLERDNTYYVSVDHGEIKSCAFTLFDETTYENTDETGAKQTWYIKRYAIGSRENPDVNSPDWDKDNDWVIYQDYASTSDGVEDPHVYCTIYCPSKDWIFTFSQDTIEDVKFDRKYVPDQVMVVHVNTSGITNKSSDEIINALKNGIFVYVLLNGRTYIPFGSWQSDNMNDKTIPFFSATRSVGSYAPYFKISSIIISGNNYSTGISLDIPAISTDQSGYVYYDSKYNSFSIKSNL